MLDFGSLCAVLTPDRSTGRIVLHYGKRVAWVVMTPNEARLFARELVQRADLLTSPVTPRPSRPDPAVAGEVEVL